jgi:hypothetical protein
MARYRFRRGLMMMTRRLREKLWGALEATTQRRCDLHVRSLFPCMLNDIQKLFDDLDLRFPNFQTFQSDIVLLASWRLALFFVLRFFSDFDA